MHCGYYRVATNLAYNALRSRRRQERRQQAAGQGATPGKEDPADVVVQREEQERVRQVPANLPARQAQLLLLYYSGLSYRELAQALHIAPGSVGTSLARAKAAFETKYRALPPARGGKGDEM